MMVHNDIVSITSWRPWSRCSIMISSVSLDGDCDHDGPWWYRHYHLTETVITMVHNDIVRVIDAGNVSALVMLDFRAVFDTVDHVVLIDLLQKRYGVRGNAIQWFRSYHTGRTEAFLTAKAAVNRKHFPPQRSWGISSSCTPWITFLQHSTGDRFIMYIEDLGDTIYSLYELSSVRWRFSATNSLATRKCLPQSSTDWILYGIKFMPGAPPGCYSGIETKQS